MNNWEQKSRQARQRIDMNGENERHWSWALDYVQAEKGVPKAWLNDFIEELSAGETEYKVELEASLRYFGIRWI